MKKLILIGVLLAACGDDDAPPTGNECGAGTTEVDGECVADAVCGAGTTLTDGMCLPDPGPGVVFRQVEHLGRPGINEALLISDGFLEGYNGTAPSFAGVPGATLGSVIDEAKTVLRALYLAACLTNGQLGLTADGATGGVKPAGLVCAKVGGAIFDATANDSETLDAAALAGANTYADAVFGLFEPDVLRIDTALNLNAGGDPDIDSSYENFCGGGPQGLCGGRFVRDDVIDVTYDFLLNGAATCGTGANRGIPALCPQVNGVSTCTQDFCASYNPLSALVGDGVAFDSATTNISSRQPADADNTQQGHPLVTENFPYSAAPL